MERLFVNLGEHSYNILFNQSFSELGTALKEIKAPTKLLIVTDTNVTPLWLDEVKRPLEKEGYDIDICIIPAGEENKNMDGILSICSACLKHKMDRKSMILALGGGVVGDMAGFAAAIYMRGIRFVQLPTTLLSQSDSSVGGKTGIDFQDTKNILGAFHQPALVYMNVSTLNTLPEREFLSGMGEVIKHGIIQNSDFFTFLSENVEDIKKLRPDYLIQMAKTNCSIKASVVMEDEKENGLRAILNFGHTIGHAIESAAAFSKTHGECVALGMRAASHIAWKRNLIGEDTFDQINELLNRYGFEPKTEIASEDDIFRFMQSDKKSVGGQLKFVLPTGIGQVIQADDVTRDEISNALKYLAI